MTACMATRWAWPGLLLVGGIGIVRPMTIDFPVGRAPSSTNDRGGSDSPYGQRREGVTPGMCSEFLWRSVEMYASQVADQK